jgi:hypothetical protein
MVMTKSAEVEINLTAADGILPILPGTRKLCHQPFNLPWKTPSWKEQSNQPGSPQATPQLQPGSPQSTSTSQPRAPNEVDYNEDSPSEEAVPDWFVESPPTEKEQQESIVKMIQPI